VNDRDFGVVESRDGLTILKNGRFVDFREETPGENIE
jgi:hypothetical protein